MIWGENMGKRALLMNEKDNVATVLDEIEKGETVQIIFNGQIRNEIQAQSKIDIYHKLATVPINKGQEVYKYGEIIGRATEMIAMGEHVHVSNIESVATK